MVTTAIVDSAQASGSMREIMTLKGWMPTGSAGEQGRRFNGIKTQRQYAKGSVSTG